MLCRKCGQENEGGQNFCRFCGETLMSQRGTQTYDPPKPYGWASPSSPLHNIAGNEPQRAQPLVQTPPVPQPHTVGYRCPRCGTTAPPQITSKISDGGWIVFVLMLLFCFPLFWIGLLMKEEQRVCSMCFTKLG